MRGDVARSEGGSSISSEGQDAGGKPAPCFGDDCSRKAQDGPSRAPSKEAGREGFALRVCSGAGRPNGGNEVRPTLRGSSLPTALGRDRRPPRADPTPREGSLS